MARPCARGIGVRDQPADATAPAGRLVVAWPRGAGCGDAVARQGEAQATRPRRPSDARRGAGAPSPVARTGRSTATTCRTRASTPERERDQPRDGRPADRELVEGRAGRRVRHADRRRTASPTSATGPARSGRSTPRPATEIWTAKIGGFVVGAPAVDGDAVYVSSGQHALPARPGDRARSSGRSRRTSTRSAQITASPVVVDGLVLQGVASAEVVMPKAEYTFRGSIGAYDAETGEEEWRFYTTPNDATGGAGVGIWSTPAVDVERGLLYVGSGNTYAEPTAPARRLASSPSTTRPASSSGRRSSRTPTCSAPATPAGKDADVGASPNLWTSDGRDLVGRRRQGRRLPRARPRHRRGRVGDHADPGQRLRRRDRLGARSSTASSSPCRTSANPETNSPTNVAKVFALDPATGRDPVGGRGVRRA